MQVSPTGFSEIVTPDGDVIDRTAVSERAIVRGTVELRTGRTWYVNLGDAPFIAALVLVFAGLVGRQASTAPSGDVARPSRQRSSSTVTGPSLTSATCISAPNRPVATVAPSRRSSATTRVDERLGVLGTGRGDPARAATLGRVAVERELADDEELGADVGGGPVHHPGLVVEQADVPQAVGELPGDGLVVGVGHADEHAQARDRSAPTSSPATRHRRLRHPLHDRAHAACSRHAPDEACPYLAVTVAR